METNKVRNLLIATIIIVIACFGYLIYSNYQLKKQLKVTHRVAVSAEDEAEDANDKAEQAESDLEDANSRIDDLELEIE